MQVKITPSPLAGTVQLPPSKSFAIRALICSALAGGGSVAPLGTSADIAATVQALADLAAGRDEILQRKRLFGALFDPGGGSFGQVGNLYRRRSAAPAPAGCLSTLLPQHGVQVQTDGGLPFSVTGKLRPGHMRSPGMSALST